MEGLPLIEEDSEVEIEFALEKERTNIKEEGVGKLSLMKRIKDHIAPYYMKSVMKHWRVLLLHMGLWCFLLLSSFIMIASGYYCFYTWYIPAERISIPVYLQYNEVNPSYTTMVTGLRPGVEYDVSLQLLVPDLAHLSESLGNVMINTVIDSKSDSLDVSRPTLLVYRSWPVRVAILLVRLVPVVLGLVREATPHRVFLVEKYRTMTTEAVQMTVAMGAKLPVYEATLDVVAHFGGLRFLMYYWRWSFAIAFVGSLTLLSTLALSLIMGVSLYWQLKRNTVRIERDEDDSVSTSSSSSGLSLSESDSVFSIEGGDCLKMTRNGLRRRRHYRQVAVTSSTDGESGIKADSIVPDTSSNEADADE